MELAGQARQEAEGQSRCGIGQGWARVFSVSLGRGMRGGGSCLALVGQVLRRLGLHSSWGKPEQAALGLLSTEEGQGVIAAKPLCQRPGGFG